MRTADPARMSRDDILAELGELFAAGFQRHLANGIKPVPGEPNRGKATEKPLAALADSEAQCGSSTAMPA